MPRPGPRPYECVRRAWHSDRHQPIRGSLIQDIFRVVNEIHSSATKKNKEWQEKLPVVVLKAEEIMYSKANSEAEYMDLKTLWDRTNDAINTIIRRDESTETGDLLQPCIEAALNLGCTPRRASRSQRNINPRCYLNPCSQDPCTFSPCMVHSSIQVNHAVNIQCNPNYSNFIKPTVMNSIHLKSEPHNFVRESNGVSCNKPHFTSNNIPMSNNNQCSPAENYPLGSIYPLYYGNFPEPTGNVLPKSVASTKDPVNSSPGQNILSYDRVTPVISSQIGLKDSSLNPHENGCDLSLRLGSLLSPLPSAENGKIEITEDVGCSYTKEASKFKDWTPQMNKEPIFFSRVNADGPLESRLSEQINVDVTMKKRKAICGSLVDDPQFCWQPKLPCNQVTSRVKSTGS